MLHRRMFRGPEDRAQMLDLVRAWPDGQLHVVDLPYRLCSWAFDAPENCALWENVGGRVLAWAALQPPFWSIDYAIHPDAPSDMLGAVLEWADRRAQKALGTPFGRPAWFVSLPKDHPDQPALEAIGFRSQADVGENSWTKVLFQRAATGLAEQPALPPGFRIRPLGGEAEVEAYAALHRAVFQSENMTVGWRRRTLAHPDYLPQLDLVLEDPAGQLAGFCVGWFCPRGPQGLPAGQIEPMGVRADLRGRGLGKALLAACLARLAGLGAATLLVETDNYRDAAFGLYSSAGFHVAHEVLVYRKDYSAIT